MGGLPFLLEPAEDEEDLALLWSYLWWRVEGWRVRVTFPLAVVVIHDMMSSWMVWCFGSIDWYWLVG